MRDSGYRPITKQCPQCGQTKPIDKFVRNPDSPDGHRRLCAVCETTNRTEAKRDRRARVSAANRRREHARRFGIPVKVLEHRYGWTLDKMEGALLRVLANGCPPEDHRDEGCGEPVSGLHDIHIDITDPDEPPYWGVNTRTVCQSCHRPKGHRSLKRMQIDQAEREAIVREEEAEERALLREAEHAERERQSLRTGSPSLLGRAPTPAVPLADAERCTSVKRKVHNGNSERSRQPSSWRCVLRAGHDGLHQARPSAHQSPWEDDSEGAA